MNLRFPICLETFNPAAQKKAFDFFAEHVRGDSVFNNSLVTFDGYSTEGVKSIDAKSTTFAYRDQNILVGPLVTYQIHHEGTGREHVPADVNYAFGDEGPEQWYGSESSSNVVTVLIYILRRPIDTAVSVSCKFQRLKLADVSWGASKSL